MNCVWLPSCENIIGIKIIHFCGDSIGVVSFHILGKTCPSMGHLSFLRYRGQDRCITRYYVITVTMSNVIESSSHHHNDIIIIIIIIIINIMQSCNTALKLH